MNQPIKSLSLFVGLFVVFLPISLWAEAPVEEASASSYDSGGYSSPNGGDPEVPLSQDNSADSVSSSSSSFNPNNPASLLSKINEMQREMQRLRGQLEVQSNEISKLKSQQQAYYSDLDQRISMLSSGKKNPVLDLDNPTATPAVANDVDTSGTKKTTSAAVVAPSKSSASSTTEESSYNAAYELIQNKQFTEATTAMKTFVQQYPQGKYAANAHYWLGELLLAQHKNSEAIKEFDIVTQDFPQSNKVSAAMLKQGFIYAQQGNVDKAKTVFLNIQKMFPGTTTAQLAANRLQSLQ